MIRVQIARMIDALRDDGTPEGESCADAWQEELDSGSAEELAHKWGDQNSVPNE